MNETKQELVIRFLDKLVRVRKIVEQSLSFEDRSATILQVHAMKFLHEHPRSTAGELAHNMHMSSSSIAQLIERLVDAGFVVRENEPTDRRVVRLSLTQNGIQQVKVFMQTFLNEAGKVFSLLPESDVKELNRIFTNLLDQLKKVQ